jgi:hypothetical protein
MRERVHPVATDCTGTLSRARELHPIAPTPGLVSVEMDQRQPLANTSFCPGQTRMSGLNYPLYLDNPGLRFCLIPEVWDHAALSVGFHDLDTDPMVLLRDQSKGRFRHGHM